MIIPKHWAEARLQQRQGKRQFTVRRFGWSDDGPANALTHAQARAQEAMEQLIAGADIVRHERKTAYNGALGAPIREEIVATEAQAVIAPGLGAAVFRWQQAARGGAHLIAQRHVQRCIAAHPGTSARLYQTPAGWRVALTHRLFDPSDPDTEALLKRLNSDPLYLRMCLNQRCFRARVSGKPWRMGLGDSMRPRSGVWPVAADKLPARQAWIDRYEALAPRYAACRYVQTIGSGMVHIDAKPVIDLHDRLCQAHTELPLA